MASFVPPLASTASSQPSTVHAPLRILYTIDHSVHYILARSIQSVPVEPIYISTVQKETAPRYARVSLTACLDALCRCSPELMQDSSLDYSVYVFDPLEEHPPSIHSNTSPSPLLDPSSSSAIPASASQRGVAAAYGLMSWALSATPEQIMPCVGTFHVDAAGRQSLEVVISLKETKHVRPNAVDETMQTWGLPPPSNVTKRKRAYKAPSTSRAPPARSASFHSYGKREHYGTREHNLPSSPGPAYYAPSTAHIPAPNRQPSQAPTVPPALVRAFSSINGLRQRSSPPPGAVVFDVDADEDVKPTILDEPITADTETRAAPLSVTLEPSASQPPSGGFILRGQKKKKEKRKPVALPPLVSIPGPTAETLAMLPRRRLVEERTSGPLFSNAPRPLGVQRAMSLGGMGRAGDPDALTVDPMANGARSTLGPSSASAAASPVFSLQTPALTDVATSHTILQAASALTEPSSNQSTQTQPSQPQLPSSHLQPPSSQDDLGILDIFDSFCGNSQERKTAFLAALASIDAPGNSGTDTANPVLVAALRRLLATALEPDASGARPVPESAHVHTAEAGRSAECIGTSVSASRSGSSAIPEVDAEVINGSRAMPSPAPITATIAASTTVATATAVSGQTHMSQVQGASAISRDKENKVPNVSPQQDKLSRASGIASEGGHGNGLTSSTSSRRGGGEASITNANVNTATAGVIAGESRKRTFGEMIRPGDGSPSRRENVKPVTSTSTGSVVPNGGGEASSSGVSSTTASNPSWARSVFLAPGEAQSDPPRSSRTRKAYVTPAWARTNTVTKPRILTRSSPSQPLVVTSPSALATTATDRRRGRKRARTTNGRSYSRARAAPDSAEQAGVSTASISTTTEKTSPAFKARSAGSSVKPIAAGLFPFPFLAPTFGSPGLTGLTSPSRRPMSTTPRTPKATRGDRRSISGGGVSPSPLFTPTPRAKGTSGRSRMFDMNHLYTSPTPSRRPPPSLTRQGLSSHAASISSLRALTTPPHDADAEDDADAEVELGLNDDEIAKLETELEDEERQMMLDDPDADADVDTEMDGPSSSLPIASSDDEDHLSAPSDKSGSYDPPRRPHWSLDLPPSSPPNSSPMMSPIHLGMSDDVPPHTDLTSESAPYNDFSDFDLDFALESDALLTTDDPSEGTVTISPGIVDQPSATEMQSSAEQELFRWFSSDTTNTLVPFNLSTSMETQEQGRSFSFDNLGFDVATSQSMPASCSNAGLDDLNFDAAWQSLQALIAGSVEQQVLVSSSETGPKTDAESTTFLSSCEYSESLPLDSPCVDHSQLAKNIQSLFSGCLV